MGLTSSGGVTGNCKLQAEDHLVQSFPRHVITTLIGALVPWKQATQPQRE